MAGEIKSLTFAEGVSVTAPTDNPIAGASILSLSSADYTVLDGDGYDTILVTTGATDRTITLPTAADNVGRVLMIKKVDSGAGIVTIDGEGSETIDGGLDFDLVRQYEAIEILCDGTEWFIIDRDIPNIFRQELLQANFTSTALADTTTSNGNFRFDNLIIGRVYRVHLQYRSSQGNNAGDPIGIIEDGTGADLAKTNVDYTGSTADAEVRFALLHADTGPFVATNATIRFRLGSATSLVTSYGSNSLEETWATIEELNDSKTLDVF